MPTYTYNDNVPQGSNSISSTQNAILNNWKALNEFVSQDHITFGGVNQGKHNIIHFPAVQGSDPTTAIGEIALFTKNNASSAPGLCVRTENNGTIVDFTTAAKSGNGWTRLPSGILLKWGSASVNGNTSVDFPTGPTIPVFTSLFNVQVSVIENSSTPNVFVTLKSIGANLTSFPVVVTQRTTTTSTNASLYYLAIGLG